MGASSIEGLNCAKQSDDDRCGQLVINVVSAVLDGNGKAASAAGDHGNGLTGIAAQREQECIQFFILSGDPADDVFGSYLRTSEIHIYPHFLCILCQSC